MLVGLQRYWFERLPFAAAFSRLRWPRFAAAYADACERPPVPHYRLPTDCLTAHLVRTTTLPVTAYNVYATGNSASAAAGYFIVHRLLSRILVLRARSCMRLTATILRLPTDLQQPRSGRSPFTLLGPATRCSVDFLPPHAGSLRLYRIYRGLFQDYEREICSRSGVYLAVYLHPASFASRTPLLLHFPQTTCIPHSYVCSFCSGLFRTRVGIAYPAVRPLYLFPG